MRHQNNKLICFTLLLMLLIPAIHINVFAAFERDQGDRPVIFTIATDLGPQMFAARHHYRFDETFEQGGNYIRYTNHSSASWCENWSGADFGSILVTNAHKADYYDSDNTYIKSANLTRDSDMIWSPSWIGYESASGTDIATVNTATSTAKAKFSVFCGEAVYGFSSYTASLTCSN